MNTINVTVEIQKNEIESLFVSAIEGGSNYWCTGVDIKDKKKHDVTKEEIEHALTLMAKNESRHFADLINGNADASTADVFFQLCTFKKVIYG